jgi:phosphoribosyl 1,2-cyclic phosphodiesterase
MIEFTTLATGSDGNAYVVRDGLHTLAIEAGLPIKALKKLYWNAGLSLALASGVLVSHKHMDHAAATEKLVYECMPCYMSCETHKALAFGSHPFARICEPAEWFKVGPWQVCPFPVKHDAHEAGTFGFIVVGPSGGKLAYLSDLAYSGYKIPDGCNVIAIEANHDVAIVRKNVERGVLDPDLAARIISSHMSIDTCLALLKSTDLSQCQSIHLIHGSKLNSNMPEFKSRVRAETGIVC